MIIPTGYAQLNFIFSGFNFARGAQVVLGVDNNAPLTAVELATMGKEAWEEHLLPLQTIELSLVEVRAKLGPNATGADAIVGSGAAGGESGDPMPPNVASLVRKVTASGGRKNRGRMYIPGVTEDGIGSNGMYEEASLATLQAALNDFYDEFIAATVPPVVLHSHPDDAPTFITGFVAQSQVATQRRRLRKAG